MATSSKPVLIGASAVLVAVRIGITLRRFTIHG
jgi:hypothetical protein